MIAGRCRVPSYLSVLPSAFAPFRGPLACSGLVSVSPEPLLGDLVLSIVCPLGFYGIRSALGVAYICSVCRSCPVRMEAVTSLLLARHHSLLSAILKTLEGCRVYCCSQQLLWSITVTRCSLKKEFCYHLLFSPLLPPHI